jgi:hypothetical protein
VVGELSGDNLIACVLVCVCAWVFVCVFGYKLIKLAHTYTHIIYNIHLCIYVRGCVVFMCWYIVVCVSLHTSIYTTHTRILFIEFQDTYTNVVHYSQDIDTIL